MTPHKHKPEGRAATDIIMESVGVLYPTVRLSLELAKDDFTPKFCLSVLNIDTSIYTSYHYYFDSFCFSVLNIDTCIYTSYYYYFDSFTSRLKLLTSCSIRVVRPCSERFWVLAFSDSIMVFQANFHCKSIKLRGQLRGWT